MKKNKQKKQVSWQKLLHPKDGLQVGFVVIGMIPAPFAPMWSLTVAYFDHEKDPQHYFSGMKSDEIDTLISDLSNALAHHRLSRYLELEVKEKHRIVCFATVSGGEILTSEDFYDIIWDYLEERINLWDERAQLQERLIKEAIAGEDYNSGWIRAQLDLWKEQKEREGIALF